DGRVSALRERWRGVVKQGDEPVSGVLSVADAIPRVDVAIPAVEIAEPIAVAMGSIAVEHAWPQMGRGVVIGRPPPAGVATAFVRDSLHISRSTQRGEIAYWHRRGRSGNDA